MKKILTILKTHRIPLLLLILTWLTFFCRTIISRYVYYLDDLKIIYYPLEQAYAQFQNSLRLPLWSPYFGFGHPLLAWGQLGFFTPLHLILRLFQLHPLTLLQVSIITYFLLGSFGMYALLIKQKLASPAAALGSIAFIFSGFNIGHLNHVNFYTAIMLLPWLLVAILSFLNRPTLLSSVIIALLGSAMALSGQPQVVLYTYIIASVFFIISSLSLLYRRIKAAPPSFNFRKFLIKIFALTIFASILAFSLSSFAILPLLEFLPSTERSAGLDHAELYEFSYPPAHAITLIFPYFFGDHDSYWGAKGFQELAAFTGIIPILLACTSLLYWQRHKPLKLFGLLLLFLSLTMALGKYSPVYTWLVENDFIKSLAVPGRFTLFFDFSVAILAALGLNDLITYKPRKRYQPALAVLAALLLTAAIFTPFFYKLTTDSVYLNRFYELASPANPTLWLIFAGIICLLVFFFLPSRARQYKLFSYTLPVLAAATLVFYGWRYNPLTPAASAYSPSPFASYLEHANKGSLLPPRLFVSQRPGSTLRRRTEPISPNFTVHQPLLALINNLSCLNIPIDKDQALSSRVDITIRPSWQAPPLRTASLSPPQITGHETQLCFDPIPDSEGKEYIISFTSRHNSGLRLLYEPLDRPSAYFVRVLLPTNQELARSQKKARVIIEPSDSHTADFAAALLSRHLNATVPTSSAHWIGALGIKTFRDFTSFFLADDGEQVDGDGHHVLETKRTIANMSGITYITQKQSLGLSDNNLTSLGFIQVSTANIGQSNVGLYYNPRAYPKAFLVPNAEFVPADDQARSIMSSSNFNPRATAIINGPAPPPLPASLNLTADVGTAVITNYEAARIDVKVNSEIPAFLVVTDSTIPQWHTYIDSHAAPYYTAFTAFKAARVPAGRHLVTFIYQSKAVVIAKVLTLSGLVITIAILFSPLLAKKHFPQAVNNASPK